MTYLFHDLIIFSETNLKYSRIAIHSSDGYSFLVNCLLYKNGCLNYLLKCSDTIVVYSPHLNAYEK